MRWSQGPSHQRAASGLHVSESAAVLWNHIRVGTTDPPKRKRGRSARPQRKYRVQPAYSGFDYKPSSQQFHKTTLRPSTGRSDQQQQAQTVMSESLSGESCSPISRIALSLELSANTATRHNATLPTVGPVGITFVFPSSGVDAALPWIMLFSGTLCYIRDYTFLLGSLAGKGYLVAIVDQHHSMDSLTVKPPADRDSSCPTDTWSAPTASIFNDVHTVLAALVQQTPCSIMPNLPETAKADQLALSSVNLKSVAILGHSFGGMVAVDMLCGVCRNPDLIDCTDYTTIVDKSGRNIIKGVILFEGWRPADMPHLVVPDEVFLTYISAQNTPFAPWTAISYERTEGQRIDYVQLRSGNHFAINDWNPNSAPHQVTPCGVDGYTNATSTFTTQADQEARLIFISELTDAVIKSHILGDIAATNFLRHKVPTHPVVQSAYFSPAHFAAVDHDLA